ncbi:OLC1v1036007C1 [Oldenlandia corymbosa var. corymbosa]|uniref:OLC1v1036007C1 n=1 Tax=Oldenlandia corymbosa var. corymbosa TaxID=529605 RepID=A0AAV1CXR5_OLDCO|nr:OLC1v1036007C1 [Oldenlandia corymbosa var. corymbosa]
MAEETQTAMPSSMGGDQHHRFSGSPPSDAKIKDQSQMQFSGFSSLNGDFQMLPAMYTTYFPGFNPLELNQGQTNHGRGLYAVTTLPSMGPIAGLSPNYLIPFTYNLPSGSISPENAAMGQDHGQQHPQAQQQAQPLQPGQQRQVRRFQVAFQLDLLLILKLVAVIFLFNQDGSRQRLVLLVFLSSLVYLYQTGALAPLIRWLSQGMQRAAAPPRPPRPDVRADNVPAVEGVGNENVAAAGGENENQPPNGNGVVENENGLEPGLAEGGNRWWGIVKEIQMIVFGFITSLLPGFHNID